MKKCEQEHVQNFLHKTCKQEVSGSFTLKSCKKTAKKRTKKVCCTCKVTFLLIRSIAVLSPFFLPSPLKVISQRRFLAQHRVQMWEQCCSLSKRCRYYSRAVVTSFQYLWSAVVTILLRTRASCRHFLVYHMCDLGLQSM